MKYEFREDDAIRFKEHVGARAVRKGDELFFAYCPYCNGGKSREQNKFSINLKTGQFECKRASCNAKAAARRHGIPPRQRVGDIFQTANGQRHRGYT